VINYVMRDERTREKIEKMEVEDKINLYQPVGCYNKRKNG